MNGQRPSACAQFDSAREAPLLVHCGPKLQLEEIKAHRTFFGHTTAVSLSLDACERVPKVNLVQSHLGSTAFGNHLTLRAEIYST